jgi:hypothetical protein
MLHSLKYLMLAVCVVLGSGAVSAYAQKKSAPKVSAPKPASHAAAHPAGHSGPSTAMRGRTGGGRGPTTAMHHGPTTSNPRGMRTTTSGRYTTASRGGYRGGAERGAGRPVPRGGHEFRTANGSVVRTRANGTRADIHDSRRGMDVHRGLRGGRRVRVERADHTRIVAYRGRRGYVQHPYRYHGREFGHRTYYYHGRAYDRYYGRYYYRGAYLDVYAPGYYYAPAFYGWAYNPWAAPITYSWGWGASPWYGYYGGYFTPYPVYASASLWLTDYLIANSLQAAYQAQVDANATNAAALQSGDAPLTPETKQLISEEVQRQIALENSESQQNAQNQDINYGSSGIARLLSDNQPHVFVAGNSLDLVDTAGQECAISQGDVLEVSSAPAPDATAATAVVLATKGGNECAKSDSVNVNFSDLQDMQNHMREAIDQGMGELQSKQGQDGLPAAPASAQGAPVKSNYAADAPPPDPNAATEIQQESQQADQEEQEVASAAPPAGTNAAPPPVAPAAQAAPATISMGQTTDQVTAALGQPKQIVNLGSKKIYIYQDMKITFKSGKVSDVQ